MSDLQKLVDRCNEMDITEQINWIGDAMLPGRAAAELVALRVVEGLYRTVCTNLQKFTHEDGRHIRYGGENVDDMVIRYARQLEAENEALREALKPFAEIPCLDVFEDDTTFEPAGGGVLAGDVRRARAALDGAK